MIERVRGNLLDADVDALVNAVNCVGVMGKGLAAQFKTKFPGVFRDYARACKAGDVQPGRMHVAETGHSTPRFVINFPTKRHWREPSRLEDIESGLQALGDEVKARRIRSIALPALGCGLGALAWDDVAPRIERTFAALKDVRALLFEPG
jgi:O-acetyl-ADP-ribose deacetylase (regulator of RNase III)